MPRFVKKGKRLYFVAINLTLIPYHEEFYKDAKEFVMLFYKFRELLNLQNFYFENHI
jgi:hypothetical protein